jgi:hypothetical protein
MPNHSGWVIPRNIIFDRHASFQFAQVAGSVVNDEAYGFLRDSFDLLRKLACVLIWKVISR